MLDETLKKVQQKIQSNDLTIQQAASAIGTTSQSLQRHLNGEYVRSDSLAKYRIWLNNNGYVEKNELSQDDLFYDDIEAKYEDINIIQKTSAPGKPFRVVDLFCGCGGMSLGFDRLEQGAFFKTVLAIDIEEPMVRVFNDNHASLKDRIPTGRQCDLQDFLNESEILAYYLDHLARSGEDEELADSLKNLAGYNLYGFCARIQALDACFLNQLHEIRLCTTYENEYRKIGASTLNQTSVVGFHKSLRLPSSGRGIPRLGTLIWSDRQPAEKQQQDSFQLDQNLLRRQEKTFLARWNTEIDKLRAQSKGFGTGQLSSASKKIIGFVDFLDTTSMHGVRDIWKTWMATREVLRNEVFCNPKVLLVLRKLYDDSREVDVMLGGPPCQGFSRIGRGKIRSLREQSVHVHENDESVDSRNQLMHQYVLFVSALAPKVFLFENVRHFQSIVKTENGSFDATEVLAEAIENVSSKGIGYKVSSRIIYAFRHLVPQKRERFFMAGVRQDIVGESEDIDFAEWCLSLKNNEPVALESALEGLGVPFPPKSGNSIKTVSVSAAKPNRKSKNPTSLYKQWVLTNGGSSRTDGHVARPPREDDRSFFALMGPGKRWMDYRCDNSPSIKRFSELLNKVQKAVTKSPEFELLLGFDLKEIDELALMVDGSLSIRLLLESIPLQPGEVQHHLLAANYLKKKDGSHGDWLARLDPVTPSKTMVSHMAKDTYAYVHPFYPRTLSVREAARIQSFPDDYKLGSLGLVDGYRVIGNAVPPLLSLQFAEKIIQILQLSETVQSIEDNSHLEMKN